MTSVRSRVKTGARLEDKVEKDEEFEGAFGEANRRLVSQRIRHPGNRNYVVGLKAIKDMLKKDKVNFYSTSSARTKGAIKARVKNWIGGIKRRENAYFKIAFHEGGEKVSSDRLDPDLEGEALSRGLARKTKGDEEKGTVTKLFPEKYLREKISGREVSDVPDWGLYDYEPLVEFEGGKGASGGGRRFVELDVSHYTDNKSRKDIEAKYSRASLDKHKKGEAGKGPGERILIADKTGWAYFTEGRLPERKFASLKNMRMAIGTGHQDYVRRKKYTDPEAVLKLKIRVPRERVFVKETVYDRFGDAVKFGDHETPVEASDLRFFQKYRELVDARMGGKRAFSMVREKGKRYSSEQWDKLSKINEGLNENYILVKKYAVAGGLRLNDVMQEGNEEGDSINSSNYSTGLDPHGQERGRHFLKRKIRK